MILQITDGYLWKAFNYLFSSDSAELHEIKNQIHFTLYLKMWNSHGFCKNVAFCPVATKAIHVFQQLLTPHELRDSCVILCSLNQNTFICFESFFKIIYTSIYVDNNLFFLTWVKMFLWETFVQFLQHIK